MENSHARERMESTWESRQQQVESSWETEAACGSRGRSEESQTERWERSNLDEIVGVSWRKNEDDPEMDGERGMSKEWMRN